MATDTGKVGVAQLVGGEIDALHEGAAVNPFCASVPTLNGGRVHQILAHVTDFHGDGMQAGLRDE